MPTTRAFPLVSLCCRPMHGLDRCRRTTGGDIRTGTSADPAVGHASGLGGLAGTRQTGDAPGGIVSIPTPPSYPFLTSFSSNPATHTTVPDTTSPLRTDPQDTHETAVTLATRASPAVTWRVPQALTDSMLTETLQASTPVTATMMRTSTRTPVSPDTDLPVTLPTARRLPAVPTTTLMPRLV